MEIVAELGDGWTSLCVTFPIPTMPSTSPVRIGVEVHTATPSPILDQVQGVVDRVPEVFALRELVAPRSGWCRPGSLLPRIFWAAATTCAST
jgi:hypothetical protein